MTLNHRTNKVRLPLRVAWLTGYIAPYLTPLFMRLVDSLDEFRIFVSTKMGPNRPWYPEWDRLNVTIQRSLSFKTAWQHPHGFSELGCVYFPYDTLLRLGKYRPDVVISGELGLRTANATIYRALHRKSRLVVRATVSECSEQGRGRSRDLLRRWLLPRADAVIVNGASGANYVRRYGVAEERIFRIPYAVERSRFVNLHPQRGTEECCDLLYVGRLAAGKGLLHFFRVLHRWAGDHPQSPVTFWLAGDGPLFPALRDFRFPPHVKVRFLGHVRYADLPLTYSSAAILVFPTLADEWGMVVSEAMASGLPVLGSVYSQAVEELVDEGISGWIFRPDRAHEMYAALDRALETPRHVLDEMGMVVRGRVQNLNPEFNADRIVQVLHFVCS